MNLIDLAKIEGAKAEDGWLVKVRLPPTVQDLTTKAERAALLEKIACSASAQASRIRQNIASGTSD